MELPIFEEVLVFSSHILSCLLALFVARKVDFKLGLLFFISFLFVYQQFYFIYFDTLAERTEGVGECLARTQNYYACVPILERISIHISQLGTILIIVSSFLLAKRASVESGS